MTSVEERLAVLETEMRELRHDVGKLVDWMEVCVKREAVRGAVETWGGKVFWIAVGTIVPIALAIAASWLRLAISAASAP